MDPKYKLRGIEPEDYYKDYILLLSELSLVEDVYFMEFKPIIEGMKNDDYHIWVIEDTSTEKIIASGTLHVEQKIIRGLAKVGHIEDVVVKREYRGQGLGKYLVKHLIDMAKFYECYKVVLDCDIGLVHFYEKCGLEKRDIQMSKYFQK